MLARRAKAIQESSNGHRHQYEIVGRGQNVALDAVGKLPIPIARRRVGDLPIPLCSNPIVGEVLSDHAAHYTTAFPQAETGRLDAGDFAKIAPGGGRFKSFRLPLRMRLVDRVVWFAVLREKPTVLRHLLKEVRHLGKKASQGHGLVREWSVDLIDADNSWYATSPDGPVLMRPLPADMEHPAGLRGARRSFGGCVGPYWQRDFWREIVEPC